MNTKSNITDSGRSWLLSDHLGGTAHTLSGTTETGEVRYRAFGVSRFTSGTTPTTYRFTGQREETSLGLYYYNARWYDPALGHFLSPDSIVPAAGNALDYHRYAYTRFNPLRYTDPTGHQSTNCDEGIDCTFQNTEWEGLLSIIFSQSQRDDLRFLWRNSEEIARQFVVINSTPNRVVGVMIGWQREYNIC